jgi:hypothetical protein
MKTKIVGIFVCMLMIATAIPAVGTLNKTINEKNVQTQSKGTYDMVIIAPSIFSSPLQKLIDHKNNHGIKTTLKTTEDIYKEYNGTDKPEQIKYFIKYALDTWNITYVLLVGGMKSYIFGTAQDDANQGSKSWYVPVRYSNLNDGYELGYITDLYYADIYDSHGNFSSWDSNHNGIFAEWTQNKKDIVDLYPDVYVGRLACTNKIEVKIMVDKIIKYESTPADPSWFKKMVVVGGEMFDDNVTNYLEGEIMCDKALSYMPEFNPVEIYASHREGGGLVPTTKDIVSTVRDGSGFLYFAGFGNPSTWDTHWPGNFSINNWTGGITCFNFPRLNNKEKLPICIASGNSLSQFNVTILGTLHDPAGMHVYGIPLPQCWSWWLTRKIGGGSIATIGDTGASYGMVGESGDINGDGVNEPDCVERYGGYMTTQFFKIYNESQAPLGEVFGETIKSYLDTFPGMNDQTDCKTIETWTLLGDPSLRIGGYTE